MLEAAYFWSRNNRDPGRQAGSVVGPPIMLLRRGNSKQAPRKKKEEEEKKPHALWLSISQRQGKRNGSKQALQGSSAAAAAATAVTVIDDIQFSGSWWAGKYLWVRGNNFLIQFSPPKHDTAANRSSTFEWAVQGNCGATYWMALVSYYIYVPALINRYTNTRERVCVCFMQDHLHPKEVTERYLLKRKIYCLF